MKTFDNTYGNHSFYYQNMTKMLKQKYRKLLSDFRLEEKRRIIPHHLINCVIYSAALKSTY